MEPPTVELSPLEVIALAAALQPFCPVALNGGHYDETICLLNGCTICRDVLIKQKEV